MAFAARLSRRSIIEISGADRHVFLQALVSNDVSNIGANRGIYAALLTPQGKFLFDLFVFEKERSLLLDCEASGADSLLARLTKYKMRSKVDFKHLHALSVWGLWDVVVSPSGGYEDPRLPALGFRLVLGTGREPEGCSISAEDAYDDHRLSLGVPDGTLDLHQEKSTVAEANFDLLNAVDWKKGCYVGQELTARMHYRGLAKYRLFPVRIEGEAPERGADVSGIGEMRGHVAAKGLASLRIESALQAIEGGLPIRCGNAVLWPWQPTWMKIDAPRLNS